ncbi:glucose/arabinose dehydrogenase/PKD repeat protein [Saccharothrix coeruleofusca]|nr:glucose/arabinose dehydrogenase/PKD repeat protein [Saccharothrix coeruleofusca]
MRGKRSSPDIPPTPRSAASRAAVAALALTTALGSAALGVTPAAAHPDGEHVLVFSKTAGFRHDSIPAGIAAITELGAANGFTVEATEDAGAFTDENLARYDAVVWLSTTGDVLDDAQQGAFERYINGGGGYAGVHAAADTEYSWPWYGELVGSYFKSHPAIQEADVHVEDHDHPATAGLPEVWTRTDEWYSYRSNPRSRVHVLASLDEQSYAPTDPSGDHPISWCHTPGQGRSWYTGMGHTKESYADPQFRSHLLGGLKYAMGATAADCEPDPDSPPTDADFDQVTLAQGEEKTGEPIALAVLPDRRVLHTSRDGRIWLTTPEATTTLAGQIPVYNHDEDGLQGVAIDPDFANNRWIYLYYAPPLDTPAGDAPENGTEADFARFRGHNQLSRFKLTEAGTVDNASEQKILQVPADRGLCCHAGGEIDFDAQGNLYLSTGDDTNPFASDGYTPIDERATRNPAFDAQRSSANTNDLRGKVLRIKVGEDGGYTIPDGNLFAPGTEKTRPEIYAMGFRNPFRFSVDKETGWIYLGDYGPDAGSANPARGPGGSVEFNLVKQPGNYGWPYCVGDNVPYVDYDFATGTSGEKFDCAAPKNTSPHNTGLVDLPPVQPAWIPYDGASVPEFGGGGESPMGGPTYRFDPDLDVVTKFPEHFDGKNFAYEWDRGWIKTIDVGPDGERGAITPFFDSMTLTRPMNLEFGPDGSLYVLDYGSGYFGGAPDSAVYRIDYTRGHHTPVAKLTADKTSGPAPLTVDFDPSGTADEDGDALTYAWDFDGDGTVDSTTAGPVSHTYTELGQFSAKLSVTDPTGLVGSASVVISVGNTAPVVTLNAPADGKVFSFGDQVPFSVTVTDPEDGQVDCSKVTVEYILGHDSHGHPLSRATGCEGVIATPSDGGHGMDANIFGVINASYTDTGAPGAPALTGSDEVILQPKDKQAEFFTTMQGVQVVEAGEAEGDKRVGHIDDGDWIAFDPVNLAGVDAIGYRVSSGGSGGVIEVRVDSPDGALVQQVAVPATGGWDNYVDIAPAPITDPGGTHRLFLVFRGSGSLFDVDAIRFRTGTGPGGWQPVQPKPAESFDSQQGVNLFDDGPAQDGRQVGDIHDGDWIAFNGVDLAGISGIGYRVASDSAGGTIEVRADSPTGPLLQTTAVGNTGGWRSYADIAPHGVTDPGGAHALYFVFRGGSGALFDVDTITFAGPGAVAGVDVPAENLSGQQGVMVYDRETAQGGKRVGEIHDGDWVSYEDVDLSRVGAIGYRVSSGGIGGTLEAHADSPDGPLVHEPLTVPVTGNWDTYLDLAPKAVTERGVRDLYLVFKGGTGGALYDVDTVKYQNYKPIGTGCGTTVEEGYRSLLDDSGTEGWKQAGPGRFVESGCDVLSTGGMGLLWFEEEFNSYSLKLDWRMAGDDNSGVFIGFPDPGDDPWVAVNNGYEIQIDPTDAPERTTGSVYSFKSADLAARDAALKPPGQWNAYELVVTGQRIQVLLNGVLINDFTSTDPARDLTQGYIGLQNHGDGDDVWFRNVRIKEIDATAPVTTATAAPPGDSGWYTAAPVAVTLAATDDSGVASTEYRVDGGEWTRYAEAVLVSGDGVHTVEYRSTDTAGNVEQVKSTQLRVDATAPLSTASFAAAGDTGWHRGKVSVVLSATDPTSGVARTEYSLDGGAWKAYTGPVEISGDGSHTLLHRAVDVAGNVEVDKAATLDIDATAPTLLVSGVANGRVYGDATDLVVSWQTGDATSGVASVTSTLDGQAVASGSLIALHALPLGLHSLAVSVKDGAGNETRADLAFATTTSLRDIAQLLDRFRATNRLSAKAHADLSKQLTKVRSAEAAGRDERAAKELERFLELAGDARSVPDAAVRAVLARDGGVVLESLRGPGDGTNRR